MEQKKILYCASTVSHLQNFHLPYMQKLQQMGFHITACVNEMCRLPFADEISVIPFRKKMMSLENVKNIVRVYRLLKKENFIAVSVHTALAAAIVRAAVLLLPEKQRPKVFATCHGYLFNENDGLGRWKYFLPEKICAYVTDVLMVMNRKDERIAIKHRLYQKDLFLIPGMGVNFSRFDLEKNRFELRREYGIKDNEVLFVFAGEFSYRKNQQELINVFAKLEKQMPDARLILAGDGALLEASKREVQQMNLQEKIIFAGHVKNMPTLYHSSDVCVSASRIEGLPFNIMEAMYCKLPCVVSNIKGHEDLIVNGENGYLYKNESELAEYMMRLYQNEKKRSTMGASAKQAVKCYSLEYVQPVIMQVYERYLRGVTND